MISNKDSNLFSDVRTKYGEEFVSQLRKWEITIKKLADYRNHRMLTLKCIKTGITPVSCRVNVPLKTNISYHIIHKAEKQLMYERIRNINYILNKYEDVRGKQFSHLKTIFSQQPNQQHDQDLYKCLAFIHKIKELRHNKIKSRQINKFDQLFYKQFGHHHNFTSHGHNEFSKNINLN